jgi:hypothetical protein
MKHMHALLSRHALPLRLHSRPASPLKENVPANHASTSKHSSRSKASVVKDYNLEELIGRLKLTREDDPAVRL